MEKTLFDYEKGMPDSVAKGQEKVYVEDRHGRLETKNWAGPTSGPEYETILRAMDYEEVSRSNGIPLIREKC
jgi:hypothetical protein